jgi:hypothetical protein
MIAGSIASSWRGSRERVVTWEDLVGAGSTMTDDMREQP